MFKIIKRVVRAPLSYLADLRSLSFRQYLMLNKQFSPSYPIMIFTSLASSLALAAFIIYFIITTPAGSACFEEVRGGTYVIAFLYPIQTVLCFICLTATIALSKNSCWKITWIVFFGPVLCGFGYGELALIEMCLLGTENKESFNVISLLKQPSFIAAMVYLYISLVILYFFLVPSIEYLYQRQKADELQIQQKQKQQATKPKSVSKQKQSALNKYSEGEQSGQNTQKSCCSRFVCILYYFLHFLFIVAFLVIFVFKVIGPILFTYIWVEMATSSKNFDSMQEKIIFALSLIAYFSPIGVTFLVLLVQAIVKLATKKPQLQEQTSEPKQRITLQITQGQNRTSKLANEVQLGPQNPKDMKNDQNQRDLHNNIEKSLQLQQSPGSSSKKQRKQSLI